MKFLDFTKAFDKVDHEILLEKVKKHGIGGKIGRWIEEFGLWIKSLAPGVTEAWPSWKTAS